MSQETSNHSFDELTRGLASGSISRGRALRLMGAALVGGALGSLGLRGASADPIGCKRTGKHCTRNDQCCSKICSSGTCAACLSGQVLCGGSCVSNSCLTNSGQVFNTSTCQCECPTDRVKLSNGTCVIVCSGSGPDDVPALLAARVKRSEIQQVLEGSVLVTKLPRAAAATAAVVWGRFAVKAAQAVRVVC